MNLPDIPTDNLYKFVALSGLAILAFSIVYPIHLRQKFSDANFEIRTELKKRNIEFIKFDKEIKDLENELEAITDRYKITDVEIDPVDEQTIDELKNKAKDPEYREYIKFMREYDDYLVPGYERLLEIGRLNENLIERQYQRTIRGVDFDMANDRLLSLSTKIFIVSLFSLLGISVGLIMTIAGFYFWYFKVQKYHDMQLKADALNIT